MTNYKKLAIKTCSTLFLLSNSFCRPLKAMTQHLSAYQGVKSLKIAKPNTTVLQSIKLQTGTYCTVSWLYHESLLYILLKSIIILQMCTIVNYITLYHVTVYRLMMNFQITFYKRDDMSSCN